MRGLSGRRALVTGGARGLGLAAARRLAEEGVAVAIGDLDLSVAEEAAAAFAGPGSIHALQLDVTDPASVQDCVAAAGEALGGIDVLVNNAGIARDALLENLDEADWEAVLDVNLSGYYRCTKATLPHLKASEAGRVVCISSRAYLGNPGQTNYSAAKAGVIGFVRALSLELGRDGITVNAIAPGLVDTDFVRGHPRAERIIERAVKTVPVGRIGQPEELGAAVAFLASDDAAYISGDVIHLTGGRY